MPQQTHAVEPEATMLSAIKKAFETACAEGEIGIAEGLFVIMVKAEQRDPWTWGTKPVH